MRGSPTRAQAGEGAERRVVDGEHRAGLILLLREKDIEPAEGRQDEILRKDADDFGGSVIERDGKAEYGRAGRHSAFARSCRRAAPHEACGADLHRE